MLQVFTNFWALIIASALGLAILLFVVLRLARDSRRGRLASALQAFRERERQLQKTSRKVAKSLSKLNKLEAQGHHVPPGKVLAAKDALAEARETERLLKDQVLVLRNSARTIILQDYPPAKHETLCRRLLGESPASK